MLFKCQTDSFLKEFTTKVIKIVNNEGKIYAVFEDTILFPEGGGQPSDYGTLVMSDGTKIEIKNVIRKGAEAWHEIQEDTPIIVGDEIIQLVDWERRLDNMQQHSGQHLISALFEKHYNFDTKAWWLGTDDSYIELDCKNLTEAAVRHVELIANSCIKEALPVTLKIYTSSEDPTIGEEVTRASKGLPIDQSGPIRVINIQGVDSNMCCGTHVTNLSQLQMVKLLNIEKAKSKILLHFLVADRILKRFETFFQRELQMNLLLNGGPDSHLDLVKKLQTSQKSSMKTIQRLSRELAIKEAEELNASSDPGDFYSLHRNDGVDIDFVNTFLRSIKIKKLIFFFITIADGIDSKSGSLIIQGSPEDVAKLGDEICKILDGKGNGKGNRYQAKVTKLNKIKDCETLIKNHFVNN